MGHPNLPHQRQRWNGRNPSHSHQKAINPRPLLNQPELPVRRTKLRTLLRRLEKLQQLQWLSLTRYSRRLWLAQRRRSKRSGPTSSTS